MEQTEIAREQGAPTASILAEQAWEGKVRKVFSWIVSVYLCVVFGAFPLYFHNYYYDILVSKYQFYWLSTVAMLASCLIAAIVFACMDLKRFGGAHVRVTSCDEVADGRQGGTGLRRGQDDRAAFYPPDGTRAWT